MAIFYHTDQLPVFRHPVLTIGTFDGVHHGHREILHTLVLEAKKRAGESIVVTFDPHPRKLLFPETPLKTLTPLSEKLRLITEAGVDHIVVVPFTNAFAQLSAADYVHKFLTDQFHPEQIIIGYDHHFGHDRTGNISLLRSMAAECHFQVQEIPAQLIEQAAVSSTKIRNALLEGKVADASKMLGRAYSLKGKVQKGAQLGRTIGFPTANILPDDADQLIPANGVYAVRIVYDGQLYNAMLNIGYRPTVANDKRLSIEANIFDFDQSVYDEAMEIIFTDWLRSEQKFPSLDALKEQLASDKLKAQDILSR